MTDLKTPAMSSDDDAELPRGAAALEHLTGPSRGKTAWLRDSALDVALTPNRFVRVYKARADDQRGDLIARFHRADDTYEIEAVENFPIWVNGERVRARKLGDYDMIEFGESGPLSRFCLFDENGAARATTFEILKDAFAYLRVSRRPLVTRAIRALCDIMRRLLRQTTILFRVSVILAIFGLFAVSYQQVRLNALLQQQLATSTSRVNDFSRALARTKEEALTPKDLQALRHEFGGQMSSTADRLAELERRSSAGARIVAESSPSVVFLQGAYAYREKTSGRMLRQIVDDDGRPLISPLGQPMLTLDGNGPVAERQFTGTGFILAGTNTVITNRHVAIPWETDTDNVEMLALQGLEPVMLKFIAYLSVSPTHVAVDVLQTSDTADLATLRATGLPASITGLKLAETLPQPGEAVIVMGYPTGLRSMLAQSGDAFVEMLQKTNDTGFWSVAARLAENGYVAPLASRGIIGQATEAALVYDAETTHGGSGGPVIGVDGAVVAVNSAILPEFGGSNLGVPVAQVRSLLATARGR